MPSFFMAPLPLELKFSEKTESAENEFLYVFPLTRCLGSDIFFFVPAHSLKKPYNFATI